MSEEGSHLKAPHKVPRLRVLLVDDDASARGILRTHLVLDGHAVVTAINAAHAMNRMLDDSFDLLITERAMQQMDGLELVAAVKRQWPTQRIIMMSGGIEPDDNPPGADVLMKKPVALAQLRAAVAEALSSSK